MAPTLKESNFSPFAAFRPASLGFVFSFCSKNIFILINENQNYPFIFFY